MYKVRLRKTFYYYFLLLMHYDPLRNFSAIQRKWHLWTQRKFQKYHITLIVSTIFGLGLLAIRLHMKTCVNKFIKQTVVQYVMLSENR